MHRNSHDGLHALLNTGAVTLIDALPEAHYAADHLPGAVNQPGELTADLAAPLVPDPDWTMVTYRSGPSCSRSKVAAAAFERLGYTDVCVYDRGKSDGAQAGLPFSGTRTPVRAS